MSNARYICLRHDDYGFVRRQQGYIADFVLQCIAPIQSAGDAVTCRRDMLMAIGEIARKIRAQAP
ncbi:hypothetical protein E05_03920 [Plautia stali symbiont]|nr:hypothetical protein E05_03920 [Plautia stali symbiont]